MLRRRQRKDTRVRGEPGWLRAKIDLLAERARAALRPAASLRGSEGVVFFVRFALVLALAFVPVAGSLTTPYGFGSFAVHVYLLVAVAFVYACGLFYMYAHDLLPAYRRPIIGQLIGGIVLLVMGVGGMIGFQFTWSVVLIGIGLAILLGGLLGGRI